MFGNDELTIHDIDATHQVRLVPGLICKDHQHDRPHALAHYVLLDFLEK